MYSCMPVTVRSVIPLIGSGCRIRFSSNTETRFSGLFRLALRSQKNVRRFITGLMSWSTSVGAAMSLRRFFTMDIVIGIRPAAAPNR